jgi:predicted dehydrogenase
VEGAYLQSWLSQNAWGDWRTSPAWLWRLSTSHGSKGVLGDVGVHLLDFASFPVGAMTSIDCTLHTFAKAPENKIGDYVLDANDSAIITARYEGGALGSLRATRWATGHHNSVSLSIFGEEGAIKIDLDKSYKELEICKVKKRAVGAWITLPCGETPNMYQRFITGIRKGVNDQPDFARGAAIQKALDACEQSHLEGRTITL